ncbi:MAG: YkgJ family cysteine cluster protein [Campylobacteraceae bacterium]|nr:YkgJ family cysteine cluster protein [Campylobacteraceae bacterium]
MIKHEGFPYAFDADACSACKGRCCTGKSGYIWVKKEEIAAIASFLQVKEEEFILQYLLKIKFRYTLKEIPFENGFACILFDANTNGCKAYEVRPLQCKSFPFWENYNQKELEDECIGILPL